MTIDEAAIREAICAARPSGDYTAADLRVATTGAIERALGRALEAPEAGEVERVVSRWFSEMCMAEALEAIEAEEREAEARRSKPGG